MKQIFKKYLLSGLFLLIPFITWSQLAMDARLTNVRLEDNNLKFTLELKGNENYVSGTNSGDFLASNIRFDFNVESGVTLNTAATDAYTVGAAKLGDLVTSWVSSFPGAPGPFLGFTLSRKSVREGNTKDFGTSEYIAVLEVNIPVTGTLTNATKIVPRDFNNYPVVNRSSIWGNGFGIANLPFIWSASQYAIPSPDLSGNEIIVPAEGGESKPGTPVADPYCETPNPYTMAFVGAQPSYVSSYNFNNITGVVKLTFTKNTTTISRAAAVTVTNSCGSSQTLHFLQEPVAIPYEGGNTDPAAPNDDPTCAVKAPYSYVFVPAGQPSYISTVNFNPNTGVIMLTFKENTTTIPLYAKVKITNACGNSQEFTFKQEGKPGEIPVPATGGKSDPAIPVDDDPSGNTDKPYTYKFVGDKPAYITGNPSNAEPGVTFDPETGKIELTFEPNPTTAPRSATVDVINAKDIPQRFIFTQDGKGVKPDGNDAGRTTDKAKPETDPDCTTPNPYTNTFVSGQGYASVATFNDVTGEISVKFAVNTTTAPRKATVKVTNACGRSREFTFKQDGIVGEIPVPAEGGISDPAIPVDVDPTGDTDKPYRYEFVGNKPTYVTGNPSNAEPGVTFDPETGKIELTFEPNPTTAPRSATVDVFNAKGDPQRFVFTQDGKGVKPDGDEPGRTTDKAKPDPDPDCTTPTPYTNAFVSGQAYASVATFSNTTGEISVIFAVNTTTAPRTATVKVTNACGKSQEFTFKQDGVTGEIPVPAEGGISDPAIPVDDDPAGDTDKPYRYEFVGDKPAYITGDPSNVEPGVTFDPNTGKIELTFEPNPTTAPRSATVDVINAKDIPQRFVFTQAGKGVKPDGDDPGRTTDKAKPDTDPDCTTPNPYTNAFVSGQEYASVASFDEVTGEISLKFAENTATVPRYATVKVTNACGKSQKFTFKQDGTCPPTAEWTGNAATGSKTDWNNTGNWRDGIVPGKCTYVTIPGGLSNYPILTTATNAKCGTIYFKQGGEVAHTYLLDYDDAKVDLTIPDNRWYMLSAPLQSMYSGDYILSENRIDPLVYMMQYQAVNPQTAKAKAAGSWSNPFNTLHQTLDLASGYAVWIDEGTKTSGNWTFSFPKTETNYKYFNSKGEYLEHQVTDDISGGLVRTNSSRFIYEPKANAEGQFSVAVPNSDDPACTSVIIGNPFMSHLDLNEFATANTGKITGQFYLWTNNTEFTSYLISGDGLFSTALGVEDNGTVAPMQSFFAIKANAGAGMGALSFSPAMETTDKNILLRSSSAQNISNDILKLEVQRDGKRNSGIAIRYNEKASNSYVETEDVWTLFPDAKQTQSAILYSVIDGGAASINSLSDLRNDIELGISTPVKGKLKIVYRNDEDFNSNCDIFLIDRMNGTTQNLRQNLEYEFDNTTGNVEGRFALRIVDNASGVKHVNNDNISIYASNNEVFVTGDNLQKVKIFNLQGQVIAKQDNIGNGSTSIVVPGQTTVIVKAYSESGVKIQKTMVSNN